MGKEEPVVYVLEDCTSPLLSGVDFYNLADVCEDFGQWTQTKRASLVAILRVAYLKGEEAPVILVYRDVVVCIREVNACAPHLGFDCLSNDFGSVHAERLCIEKHIESRDI